MHTFRISTVILFLSGMLAAFAGASSPNEYVKLEVRPVSATMRPGTSGTIELRFLPAEGIHVNVDPPVIFSLDSASTVSLKGKPAMTKDPNTGYLSTAVPVKQRLLLPAKLAPGACTVRGAVTYFYCSDSEGWCNRQKEAVEFTIMVKP